MRHSPHLRSSGLFRVCLWVLVLAVTLGVSARAGQLEIRVTDAASGEPIPGINVLIQGRAEPVQADDEGVARVDDLSTGAHRFRVWEEGYQVLDWQDVTVPAKGTVTEEVSIALLVYDVGEVTITGRPSLLIAENPNLPFTYLENNRDRIRHAPGTFQDPFRSLQVLPGVTAVNDLAGLVRVRGGTPDQNLYLVDGIPLHNPYRMRILFGGGISMFNIDLIEDITLHAGGFSARHGNRLSSVIEVTTREGNRSHTTAKASASVISANALVEGPLPDQRGSWLFSARRTYYDVALGGQVEAGTTLPNFHDFQLKTVYDIDETQQVAVEALYGSEQTKVESDEFFSFGDETATIADSESSLGAVIYRYRPGEETLLELRGSYVHDENTVNMNEDGLRIADLRTKDFGSSFRGELARASGPTTVRLGMELNWSHYRLGFERDPGASNLYFPTPSATALTGRKSHNGLYAEVNRRFRDRRIETTIGVRGDETTINQSRKISPRFALTLRPARSVNVDFATGLFYQAPEPSLVFARERGYDFGTSIGDLDSERAAHYNLGVRWRSGTSYGVRVEGYYRDLDHALVPRDQLYHASSEGEGFSSGVEVFLEKNASGDAWWNGFVSYAYSHARLRGGIYREWTRPPGHGYHNAAFSIGVDLGRSWAASSLVNFSSGAAYAALAGRIPEYIDEDTTGWIPLYETTNDREWPDYFRWDLRVDYRRSLFGQPTTFFVELINVTDRDNVVGLVWNGEFTDSDVLRMLPRFPSFGFSVGF